MAYAVYTDVQSEFKSIDFTAAGAAISSTEVTEFIVQEEAALEAEVSSVYTVPVTGTKALSIMKLMTIMMVKARILEILPVKTGNQTPDQGDSPSDKLRTRVREMLDNIKEKKFYLVDAVLLQSDGGIGSYAVTEDLEHEFKKGESQW